MTILVQEVIRFSNWRWAANLSTSNVFFMQPYRKLVKKFNQFLLLLCWSGVGAEYFRVFDIFSLNRGFAVKVIELHHRYLELSTIEWYCTLVVSCPTGSWKSADFFLLPILSEKNCGFNKFCTVSKVWLLKYREFAALIWYIFTNQFKIWAHSTITILFDGIYFSTIG